MTSRDTNEVELHIIELESKLAFQDDAMQHLSNELLEHQKRIDLLQRQVVMLAKQLSNRDDGDMVSADQEPPPPHY
ncbi:SlyX family protein [Alkalimonas collagenimarina]|uniref:Protein SlyX homolog n=1 Tax=Alkalimonas collagenimarina TaxID=400390 RepID=A0ABT9GZT9_9GAMM|nr:SlyX family protein [Alkalimonas collagenimarina]MDP4536571.1 SlyX family protein [Alkalimonas collagenimarina]